MSAAGLLVFGKATLWFALPLAFAVWQVLGTRARLREADRATTPAED